MDSNLVSLVTFSKSHSMGKDNSIEPLVSILMPVKNTAQFLPACLDSIVAQSEPRWELIAINDHSTDHSRQILSTYAGQDSRIKFADNQGEGIILALRQALGLSAGKYITRMDSDDHMSANKIELMLQMIQRLGHGHVAVGMVKYFSKHPLGDGYQKYSDWLNSCTRSSNNFNEIYRECTIPSPCWMVHRKDLKNCGGFDSDLYPEDYDLAFRFRSKGLIIAPIFETIHFWRDYPSRTSRTSDHYADNRFLELKTKYFIEQDLDSKKTLIVWGAGGRGKKIVNLLKERNIKLRWICNNFKKIGRRIYGITLEDLPLIKIEHSCQVIIAVSSPQDENDIMMLKKKYSQHQYFHFC